MCVYMDICTLMLDPGLLQVQAVGAQVIKTCDWNNYKHSPFHDPLHVGSKQDGGYEW